MIHIDNVEELKVGNKIPDGGLIIEKGSRSLQAIYNINGEYYETFFIIRGNELKPMGNLSLTYNIYNCFLNQAKGELK